MDQNKGYCINNKKRPLKPDTPYYLVVIVFFTSITLLLLFIAYLWNKFSLMDSGGHTGEGLIWVIGFVAFFNSLIFGTIWSEKRKIYPGHTNPYSFIGIIIALIIASSAYDYVLSTPYSSSLGNHIGRIEIIEPVNGEVKTILPGNLNVTIKVFDENNRGLSKVNLKFEGCGLSETHKTGSDGIWTGTLKNVNLAPNIDISEIRITAKYKDQSKTTSLIVYEA